MKNILLITFLSFSLFGCGDKTVNDNQIIFTSDIDNFWSAYDKIAATTDSIKQAEFLEKLFIDKGTPGQKSMIEARNYSVEEYLSALRNYPEFWTSIRENTYQAKTFSKELKHGIDKLKILYPDLKPAKIYFTIGALKSNGTTMDSLVLIGSELAFANKNTPTEEFPEYLSHLRTFFDSEPSQNIVFLNIHEYIHTQQKTTIGNSLLAQTIIEGVAEFLTEKALNTESPNPQIKFGNENDARIKAKFELEMFSPNISNWIWNSAENEFGMRDLAYYVGYKISEQYYNTSSDKQKAIELMINLQYNNEEELIKFVEKSGYFSKPLAEYKVAFEDSRPRATGLGEIQNKSKDVSTDIDILTINFSQQMNTQNRNFELGPLGKENVIRITDFLGFSEDGKSVSFQIEKLEPLKTYQIIVGSSFRNIDGVPLVPYLIDFSTAKK
jgi:hypothetical protein